MKNKNKTLKRLTATFLTAISVFNFTVPGKAEVVNFQENGSILYGKENDKIISAKDLEEIRGKIATEFDANKLGREYTYTPTDYNTRNFRVKISVSGISPENIGGYTKCRTDKEFVFEYSGIKDVYIIYSVDGSIEKDQHNEVESDKNEGYFNQFDPGHKDSIFLVIAPDAEWEKMEEIYKKEDVQNKFIRFGSIYDTGKTLNLDITVGVDDGNNTELKSLKSITLTERKINFIGPTLPKPQPQPQQPKPQQQNNNNNNNNNKKKSYLKPILIGCCGILVACLISIPFIGPIIKQHIKNSKTKVNINK